MRRGLCAAALYAFVFLLAVAQGGAPAEELRSQCESFTRQRAYSDALRVANTLCDEHPYDGEHWYLRAQIHIKEKALESAIVDLDKALELSPNHMKALKWRAHTNSKLERCQAALDDYRSLVRLVQSAPPDAKAKKNPEKAAKKKAKELAKMQKNIDKLQKCVGRQRSIDVAIKQRNWEEAMKAVNKALMLTPNKLELLLKVAEIEFLSGEPTRALTATRKVLKVDPRNVAATKIRGQSYYAVGDLNAALDMYKEALRYAPDDADIKELHRRVRTQVKSRQDAQELQQKHQHKKAIPLFYQAARVDPKYHDFNREVLLGACESHLALKQADKAIQACSAVLGTDNTHARALLLRGRAFLQKQEYDRAIGDFKSCAHHHRRSEEGQECHQSIHRVENLKSRANRKDFYKILGVSPQSTDKQIRKAFRKEALICHPDKIRDDPDREAKEARFLEIQLAYEVLSDPESRRRYDEGEDMTGKGKGKQQQPQRRHGGFESMFQNVHVRFG